MITIKDIAIRGAALLVALVAWAPYGNARAQETTARFPDRPVRWVIPFPPGGTTDVVARMVAEKLTDQWGQPVVVENKAGATGAIGSRFVASAPPDGYTLLMGTASTHAVAPAVNPKLPYRNLADFTPVTLVATFPNLLVVHPSVPAQNVRELIDLLKAHPDRYNFASTGTGGSVHMAGELFKLLTGTQMSHVPYKGSSEALADLMAGRVQLAFDNMATVWPLAQQGRLRALGVTSLERTPLVPDLPAVAETVQGFEAPSWVGIFAPAGVSSAIAQKIADSVAAVMRQPDIVRKLNELGAMPASSSPAAFAQFVAEDTGRWRKVADKTNIQLQ